MAHINLSSAKACRLCGLLITKDGLIGGEDPVSECPRDGCPLRQADEEKRARADAARAAASERRAQRQQESRARRNAFFARIGDWWQRWRSRKTPEGKIGRLQREGERMRERRESAVAALSQLQDSIRQKKSEYEAAPAARQSQLRPELKLLLRRHRHQQREIEILFENETAIEVAVGHQRQTAAYRDASISESDIDTIAIDLEDAAGDADKLAAAVADMESAGRRESNLLDAEIDADQSFSELLASFDEEESPPAEKNLEKPTPTDLYLTSDAQERSEEPESETEGEPEERPRRLEDPE